VYRCVEKGGVPALKCDCRRARCTRSGCPRPKRRLSVPSIASWRASKPSTSRPRTASSRTVKALLAFYDFPAGQWVRIRTTNLIDSAFATIRRRRRSRQRLRDPRQHAVALVQSWDECAGQLAPTGETGKERGPTQLKSWTSPIDPRELLSSLVYGVQLGGDSALCALSLARRRFSFRSRAPRRRLGSAPRQSP
jgi:hypothetical protein